MTALRDLQPGDRFVILRAPSRTYIRGSVGEDPGHVWCEDVENINWSAHVPLGERVRKVGPQDRRYGAEQPKGAGVIGTPRRGNTYGGGPSTSGRGTSTDSVSSHAHRIAHGSTPGRFLHAGALRLARDGIAALWITAVGCYAAVMLLWERYGEWSPRWTELAVALAALPFGLWLIANVGTEG